MALIERIRTKIRTEIAFVKSYDSFIVLYGFYVSMWFNPF
jgi:hypothetical protein